MAKNTGDGSQGQLKDLIRSGGLGPEWQWAATEEVSFSGMTSDFYLRLLWPG